MSPHRDAVTFSGPLTVIFYGIQGAGKGTQAKLLKEYFETHDHTRSTVLVGMGDLFRQYMATHDTYFARHIQDAVSRGDLLPELVAAHVLTGCIANHMDVSSHLILDGAGRTPNQVELLDQLLRWIDRPDYRIIRINLTPDIAIARMKARGRADDATEEQIKTRFDAYERDTMPALAMYEQKGHSVEHVNGDAPVEEVHRQILHILGLPAI